MRSRSSAEGVLRPLIMLCRCWREMPNSRACSATDLVILEPIALPLIFETVMSIMETLACTLTEYNKESLRIPPNRILVVNMQEREDLSALVQRRIRELNLSNSEVARRAKLSRSYIGNIVNRTAPTQSGQYNLSPEAARNLALAIEVSDNRSARGNEISFR